MPQTATRPTRSEWPLRPPFAAWASPGPEASRQKTPPSAVALLLTIRGEVGSIPVTKPFFPLKSEEFTPPQIESNVTG